MILHAVVVPVSIRAAEPRRVWVVADRHRRALVRLVDDPVAVVVLPVGEDRGRRRGRGDDDRRGAAGAVRVGRLAGGHAGAEVRVVEHVVVVGVGGGATGARGVGGPTRRNRRALVGAVGDAVAVLVAAATREGAGGEDGGEDGNGELAEHLVHGRALLGHVRNVARHCWRVVPASCRRGFLGTNARPEKREDFRPSAVKLVWVGSKEQRLLSDSEAKSSEILVPKSDLRQQ